MRAPTLALVAVLAAALPARSGERLSPEILLPGHGATDACRPATAFGKDVYLLAWQAGRNEKADIVGLRLDRTGRPLEAKPFVISAAKDCQARPRVAFGGGVFLVVWHDLRNEKDWDVFAARVSPEGKVLDRDGIAVAQAERSQCEPSVTWDGKSFQVLWRAFQGEREDSVRVGRPPAAGYHIYGGRVSTDGRLLDGAGVFMAKPPREYLTPRSMGMPAAAPLPGGGLVAAARSGTSLCLWRVAGGKPASEPKLATKRSGFDDVAFATSGRTALAVWTTFRDGGGRSSGVSKSGMLVLGADGQPASAEPKSLSTTIINQGRTHVRHPSPAWDGKRYVVAWDAPMRPRGKEVFHYEALFLRCFGPDGAPQGDDVRVVDDPAGPAWRPAVASDGGGSGSPGGGTTLVAYERHPKTGQEPIRIAFRMLK